MRVLIVEDEAMAVRNLVRLLEEASQDFQVMAVVSTVASTVAWLQDQDPDLIFMDIHLEDGSCFEIFDAVTVSAPIIFVTAFEQYALQAFEFNSLDYLLKPISPERFQKAIAKLTTRKLQSLDPDALARLMNTLRGQADYKTRFLVRQGESLKSIPIEEIAYFKKDDVVVLVTWGGRRYPVNFALDDLRPMLDPRIFMRLNRQYVASIHAIGEVKLYFKGKLRIALKPDPGEMLTISQEKAAAFKAWLDR